MTSPLAATGFDRLQTRLRERTARVAIIGLGYVGLPLARAFADRGFAVLGLDTDASKVTCLQNGESYIKHVPGSAVQSAEYESLSTK